MQQKELKLHDLVDYYKKSGQKEKNKLGQWIRHIDEYGVYRECSKCHSVNMMPTKYCPNCGVKMEV